jgi:opacity protein-like surface antigen
MKRVSLVTLILILSTQIIVAQNFDLGSWNIVNLKLNVNNKWSLFGESQLRSLKFYNNFHYYEYKAGFNYKFNNNATFTLGAGSYQTYREGGDFLTPKNIMFANTQFSTPILSIKPPRRIAPPTNKQRRFFKSRKMGKHSIKLLLNT